MDTSEPMRPVRPGYRLHRLEVLNWGTFDSTSGSVFSVTPEGRTTLLVGQNGSGKSTLVDAVLTLLVPSGIRNYNVAAGARKTERSERSYVRGAYGRASDADQSAITQYLRPGNNHYSAILAVFTDEILDRSFTVCQVLHQTADGGIEKTFAIADSARRLSDDLSNIRGADAVRSRLLECGYKTTKKYVEYNQWFARRTGIRGKAMDMFNQTVAVKDIQSLNDFIRNHMLEAHDWREKLQKLLAHFSELSAAHRELVRVRQAKEMLEPAERVGLEYQQQAGKLQRAERMLEAADIYFRTQTLRLYEPLLLQSRKTLADTTATKQRLGEAFQELVETIRGLKNEIEQTGGERLRLLPMLISHQQTALAAKRREYARFHAAVEGCGLTDSASNIKRFEDIVAQVRELANTANSKLASLTTHQEDLLGRIGGLRRELRDERGELEFLKSRQTNLPAHLAAMRERLCEDLQLSEKEIPFAAELIAVRGADRQWEASAEMVLRSFALSLLVPEKYYRRIRTYVEQNKMVDAAGRGQRLVYLSIRPTVDAAESGDRLDARSLIRKLEYRPGYDLTAWVRGEIASRFDYMCCETLEEFDQVSRYAMTTNRHIKMGGQRHEKDDRPRAVDPRNFVLGWDNREKRRAVAERIEQLETELGQLDQQLIVLSQQAEHNRRILEASRIVLSFSDFDAIDVNSHMNEIASLEREKTELENSNDAIQALKRRLQEVENQLGETQARRDQVVTQESDLQKQIASGESLMTRASKKIEDARLLGSLENAKLTFAELDVHFAEPPLDIENLFVRETDFVTATSRRITLLRDKLDPLAQQLVGLMGRYLREFKAGQNDLDARTDSLSSFLEILEQIRNEDLPRHEKRFKDRLNDKVSQEVALFHASLRSEAKQIEEKIGQLNKALGELEYQPGSFMRLEPRPVKDREILDFQRSLRECLDDAMDGSDAANEARFLRIEQLINRLSDTEKTRWRDKVIDVRRWFDFAAREVDRASDNTLSYYEDSSGQSGGEKAKLAFTILVAAIAYQYDLDPTGRTPGKFHFVCVDEMFSKVDDRYAEYAMRLFEQFGLQVLIVAPLDAKARVTEPFVDCYLHVVKGAASNHSQIFSMTAREYETVVGGFIDDVPKQAAGKSGRRRRTTK